MLSITLCRNKLSRDQVTRSDNLEINVESKVKPIEIYIKNTCHRTEINIEYLLNLILSPE